MAKYHTLALWDRDNSFWAIEFGDYSKADVKQERKDILDKGDLKAHEAIIVTTDDDQASITAAVAALEPVK